MKRDFPLPKRLKEARLAAGLSQKALGIAVGIDEFSASPRMNQYETGKHIPDYVTLSNIADILHVPVPYFYASDDLLAEIIKVTAILSKREKEKILSNIS